MRTATGSARARCSSTCSTTRSSTRRPAGESRWASHAVGDRLRFCVSDEGLGIPAGEQERIFDKFYRLDPDQRRAHRRNRPRPLHLPGARPVDARAHLGRVGAWHGHDLHVRVARGASSRLRSGARRAFAPRKASSRMWRLSASRSAPRSAIGHRRATEPQGGHPDPCRAARPPDQGARCACGPFDRPIDIGGTELS